MIIQHATIATSRGVLTGDIRVDGESITEIAPRIEPFGEKTLDADGLIALPGGVDAHTHMDLDVGIARASDDFRTGTIAAACGGTTSIVDHMGFGPEGCRLRHQLDVYHGLADGMAVVDYGFHGVLQHVDDQVLEDMESLISEGLTSYKAYLTYAYRLDDAALYRVLRRCGELGLLLTAHAENHGLIEQLRADFAAKGQTDPKYHPLSRPDVSEAEAVNRLLLLAEHAGAALYIVHLSSELGLRYIQAARQNGQQRIYAETCPQYLLLEDSLYDDPQEGQKYIMSPPLRKEADQHALWEGLMQSDIQTVATDHCPFFLRQKKRNFLECPNGAPGVQLRMALMFSEGYKKGRLSLPRLARVCSTNPARLFGLKKKGDIAPGMDADIVFFDPTDNWLVSEQDLRENVDYTPYDGMPLKGWPVMTMSRGEIIAERGKFVGREGRGRFLLRKRPLLS